MKITFFELLHEPFVDLGLVADGCEKSCKVDPKRVQIRRKMNTEKHGFRFRNGKKYTPSLDVPKCIKMRSFLRFPVLLCSGKMCRNHVKLRKNIAKLYPKNAHPGFAIAELTALPPSRQNGHPERFGPRPGHALDGRQQFS